MTVVVTENMSRVISTVRLLNNSCNTPIINVIAIEHMTKSVHVCVLHEAWIDVVF